MELKTKNKIYYTISYSSFFVPPFVYLILMSLNNFRQSAIEDTGLLFIIGIVLASVFTAIVMIRMRKLHMPDKDEIRHLIVGLIAIVLMYMYTFQTEYDLGFQNAVTVYGVILVLTLCFRYIIKKPFFSKDLIILSGVFLVFDFLSQFFRDNCYSYNGISCTATEKASSITFYAIIGFMIIGYLGYRVYENKINSISRIINVSVILLIFVLLQFDIFDSFDFFLNIIIIIIFSTLFSIIYSLVNKRLKINSITFYIKSYTLLFVLTLLTQTNFFKFDTVSDDILSLMILVTYVVMGLDLIEFRLKDKINKENDPTRATLNNVEEFILGIIKESTSRFDTGMYISFGKVYSLDLLSNHIKKVYSYNKFDIEEEKVFNKSDTITHMNISHDFQKFVIDFMPEKAQIMIVDLGEKSDIDDIYQVITTLTKSPVFDGIVIIHLEQEDYELESGIRHRYYEENDFVIYKNTTYEKTSSVIVMEKRK